jgi:hypothetical protein
MKQQESTILTNADQTLHSMIGEIDSIKGGLNEANKESAEKVAYHLLQAHAIIHNMDYSSSEEDEEPLPQQEVKNLPTKIYLQIGDDHWDDKKVDFKDLHEVSWCEDKINSNDIPYVLESQLSEALAKIKSQEAEIADLRKQLK